MYDDHHRELALLPYRHIEIRRVSHILFIKGVDRVGDVHDAVLAGLPPILLQLLSVERCQSPKCEERAEE